MVKATVQLKDIEEVKNFVTTTAQFPFEIDLIAGRYVINAKSIMGVLSLDLGKPLKLEIHAEEPDEFLEVIDAYLVK